MMRRTSVCVQRLNDASDDDAVLDIGGGSSPAVADRTSRTFLSKNLARLSAVWSVLPATSRSRPSSGDRERHSNDDERPHWLRQPTQYSSYWRGSDAAGDVQRRPKVDGPRRATYVGSGAQDADSCGVQRGIRRRTTASADWGDGGRCARARVCLQCRATRHRKSQSVPRHQRRQAPAGTDG